MSVPHGIGSDKAEERGRQAAEAAQKQVKPQDGVLLVQGEDRTKKPCEDCREATYYALNKGYVACWVLEGLDIDGFAAKYGSFDIDKEINPGFTTLIV